MTALALLPELMRSFFSLWALLLCVVGIFAAALSVRQKQFGFAALSLFPLCCAYLLWQVLFDLHLTGPSECAALSRLLGSLPWLCWPAALAALTAAATPLLVHIMRNGKRSITPAAVKLCLDQMPCGVCCWHDNGRVLFSNLCMNRLCVALTCSPLLNGNSFYDRTSGGILTVDGRVWRFACRDMTFDGERLHEMIASDITTEYAKTKALEQDKAELSRLKRRLQEYSLIMEDAVRRQEILQAKVNIHDEMNRLMLSTMAAEKDDTQALNRIFSLWEQNALLLCMQADDAQDQKAVTHVHELADALGIGLIWSGDVPPALTEKQRALFFTAAQEAVINAAKHAEAKTLEITFTDDETTLCCAFINGGNVTAGDVNFVGGLANLALLAGEQGAFIRAKADKAFTLSLHFPKNG